MHPLKNPLELRIVTFTEATEAIERVRREVFQKEQGVEADLDFDGLDENAVQLVAYWNEEPVGTARIRELNDSPQNSPHRAASQRIAKVERVAVLQSFRGAGVGQALMQKAIEYLTSKKVAEVKVNAQIQVKNFYERLGFQQQGECFYEAGILHVEMRRSLKV